MEKNKLKLYIGGKGGIHVVYINIYNHEINIKSYPFNGNLGFIINHDNIYYAADLDNGLIRALEVNGNNINELEWKEKFTFSTNGTTPAHLSYYHINKNRFILAANYDSCNFGLWDGIHGTLLDFKNVNGNGPNKNRQEKSHPHYIHTDPLNKYVFVCDLGADKIWQYILDKKNNKLIDNGFTSVTSNAGVRHLAFHPYYTTNYMVYSVNELNSTIDVWYINQKNGKMEIKQSNIPLVGPNIDINKQTAAEIQISPDGLFLYVTNRGIENSISIFKISQDNWLLNKISINKNIETLGKSPRHFSISKNGYYLIVGNENSNNIVLFCRNIVTGELTLLENIKNIQNPEFVQFYE